MTDEGDQSSGGVLDSAQRARFLTRWIGTGIGAALLVTVLVLAFIPDCVSQTQAHVLAVCLALGAAIVLWGVVGGLKVDLRLKFKALGEVAAGGVAAIFLIIHFTAKDGLIAPEGCVDGQIQQQEENAKFLYGRVYLQGAEAEAVAHANVKVEMEDIQTRVTNANGEFDIIVKSDIDHIRVWVEKDGFYTSVPVDETVPLGSRDKLRIPMVKLVAVPVGEDPPIREFPTFVEEWDDALAIADIKQYKLALRKFARDARMLTNWSRRAHAAGHFDWAARFFEAAQKADPSGKVWYSDQAYLGSAYEKLGRLDEAKALQEAVEKAVQGRDPRINAGYYDKTVGDLGVIEWRGTDRLPAYPGINPKEFPGINPKEFPGLNPTGNPKDPTGLNRFPTANPKDPTGVNRYPTANPKDPTGVNRYPTTGQPLPTAEPVGPKPQPIQPGTPTAQPKEPIAQPTTQPQAQPKTQPQVQPQAQPKTQPQVQPKTQPQVQPVQPIQPVQPGPAFPRGTTQPMPRTPVMPSPR
ncbi:MAG: hypothetical protein AAF799_45340 [Myxococcota bacterium]